MWIFENPKNYSDMMKKIALTMFIIVLISLFVFSNFSSPFSDFMLKISFDFEYELAGGIKLYISYLYLPLIFTLLENIFKLHDKISDLFQIRYRFDRKIIIQTFLIELNMTNKYSAVNKNNRKKIMKDIFYKYVSSTKPIMDTHLIYMALGQWCWYWICIDLLFFIFIL